MFNRRKLPVGGVQTFSVLRKDFDVYVDKTMHIYKMASRYRAVFLSRPRRFGKSLLCSTIESLFRGEKELFNGIAISKTDWDWKPHPVIYIDLSAENYTEDGVEKLNITLNRQLDLTCDNYGISIEKSGSIADKFARIIIELFKKSGSVAVIIDEYDSPLLATIDQEPANTKLREELKGFYTVIKQYGKHIRFAFITGITKFAQVSMFSGMNQANDISMDTEYCDICGITQDELETFFAPEIDMYAQIHGGRENYLSKLRDYYNGYYFSEKKLSVYNTYGILNHFDKGANFSPNWSLTGAPSFLVKYLEKKAVDIVKIEEAQMEADKFGDYRDNSITLFPLLYQAGYLTISDYDERTGYYKLNYPNVEVRKTLAQFLSDNYSNARNIIDISISVQLVDALLEGKADEFIELLKYYLEAVDYSLSSRISEYYFEFAVSNIINMLGLVCVNEVHTARGRMDSVIYAGEYIYILEFKVDKPVENALRQIKEKDYGFKFKNSGKKIIKAALVFSREMRNIVEWEIIKDEDKNQEED